MAAKISNEIKIGIMVVATLALFIFGFNFLRGRGVFSSENEYYVFYKDIKGLQEAAVIQLNGYNIGKVGKIELQPNNQLKVTLLVKKDIAIPQGTVAQLASSDLISGTKNITLVFGNSTAILPPESKMEGKEPEGLLDNLSSEVSPIMIAVHHAVTSLDTLLNTVNHIINEDTRRNLNASFASLEVTLKELSVLSKQLNAQSGNLAGVIKNANSITDNLANNNGHITNTLTNLESFSTSLNNAPIQQTVDDLQKTVGSLQGIVGKIDQNNGSLGLLLNDKKLYNNLSNTLGTLDTLLGDLKQHPAKYINVSVFGRKAQ